MARRHDSLVPLSHQHQHALALAVIIRRRFGAEKGQRTWQGEMVAKVQKAYQAELQGHFEVEETVLFPQMERHLGRLELVSELLRDHQSLRNFVKQLEEVVELHTLDGFAALLEAHVRKEERQLFVEFEKRMPAEEAVKIGREIAARLIKACPRPCIDSLSH